MKINFIKKISTLSLVFFVLPFFSFAQTPLNNVITDIDWSTPSVIASNSIAVDGRIITNGSGLPFGFMLEWGIPQSFSTVGNQVQITQYVNNNSFSPGPFFGAPLTPAEYLNAQNQFSGIRANNLWPSQYYYFDIRETNVMPNPSAIPTQQSSLLDYYITRTARPNNLAVQINPTFTETVSVSVSGVFNTNSVAGVGTLRGMPIKAYISTQPADSNISAEVPPPLASRLGESVATVGPNDGFSFSIGGLSYNQDYYVTLVNDQSGLFLLEESILLNFPPPDPNTGGTTGGGLLNPGQLSTGEDFSSGLITCDGVDVPCTFEKLLLMINRVINFFIYIIAGPIIALTFAYAGFLMVTSGGNPSKKDEAKGIMGKAIIGFVLLLAAWLIVKTVLVVFGYTGPLLTILGI